MKKTKDLTGSHRCAKRKQYDSLTPVSKFSDQAQLAAIAVNAAKGIGIGMPIDRQEILKAFDEHVRETTSTKIMRDDMFRCLDRYASCETRKGDYVPDRSVVLFGEEEVMVKPHALFRGEHEKGKVVRPYLELVMYRFSRPNVTERGRNPDAGIMTNLEMYCLLSAGKDIARELLKDGEEIDVGASFYFLRKESDSATNFDPDFFEKKKGEKPQAVTLWDTVVGGDDALSSVDTRYVNVYEEYKRGVDMCGSGACRYCDIASACGYEEPEVAEDDDAPKGSVAVKLTDAQEAAVNFKKGNARIKAGAGSGKTTVIVERTARLVENGTNPQDILLITFTNAGAGEFSKRIRERTGGADVICETFNSFGDMIVRANHEMLGFSEPPRLIDDVERMARIADLLEENVVMGLDYEHFDCSLPSCKGALPIAAKVFDTFKRKGMTGEMSGAECSDVLATLEKDVRFISDRPADGEKDPRMATIWCLYDIYAKQYVPGLKADNLIEYDDQVGGVLELLKADPDVLPEFKHIIVDEFQDTSPEQFKLLKALTKRAESLVVVGDDSQAIYGFRGTSPEFIINFEKELGEEVTDFYLLENFRSTPQIIAFANKINALNKNRVKKDMVAMRADGPVVQVVSVDKPKDLTNMICALTDMVHEKGIPYEDIAYIAYTRSELMRAQEALAQAGITATLMCPEPALDNPRIKAALSFASLVREPEITKYALDFLGVYWKGELGSAERVKNAVSVLCDTASHIMSEQDSDVFNTTLAALDEEPDEVYEGFLDALSQHAGLIPKLSYCADFSMYGTGAAYRKEGKYDGVTLVTAHSAKGLEYPVVINDVSKYDNPGLSPSDVEERRRLMFVSATRARDRLIVMGKAFIQGNAGSDDVVWNRFLEEAEDAV